MNVKQHQKLHERKRGDGEKERGEGGRWRGGAQLGVPKTCQGISFCKHKICGTVQ